MKTGSINYTVLHTFWIRKKKLSGRQKDRRRYAELLWQPRDEARQPHIYICIHILCLVYVLFSFHVSLFHISTCLMPALWVWASPKGPVPYNMACSGCECEPGSARAGDHSCTHDEETCTWAVCVGVWASTLRRWYNYVLFRFVSNGTV